VLIFLNGQFVSEEEAVVSVFDRGFLYGDGLFETMLVLNGKPFRWEQHLERLHHGAGFLKIKVPFSNGDLREFAGQLVAKNSMSDAILRLTLSRGVGVRGYSPKGAERTTLVMSLHPAPGPEPRRSRREEAHSKIQNRNPELRTGQSRLTSAPTKWKLITSSVRLPAGEPLAQFKTSNKLPQVLARAEADAAGADEALLLNTDNFVVEGTGSNLFWVERDAVCTPPLASGILPGVTRAVVLEICKRLGLDAREVNIASKELLRAQGAFLSLSSWGIVEALTLDGRALKQSPLVERLHHNYWELVRAETA
jgi:branched-chain amino acid aminotransferase